MTSTLEKCGIFRLWLGKVPKDTTLRLKIDDEKVEAAMQDQALLIGILQDVDCIAEWMKHYAWFFNFAYLIVYFVNIIKYYLEIANFN